jgi:hypothetical protein
VQRALGVAPIAVVAPDARVARKADLGLLPKRIPRGVREVVS